jgi:hypothetical protein
VRFKASLHRVSPKNWTGKCALFPGRWWADCLKFGLIPWILRKGQADTCPEVPNF